MQKLLIRFWILCISLIIKLCMYRRCNRTRFIAYNSLCTVFIENLRCDTNEDDLIDYFGTFGPIIDVSMPPDAADKTKNMGYCFITYAEIEAADKVLEARHILKDSILDVKPRDNVSKLNHKRLYNNLHGGDDYSGSKRRRI